MWASGEEVGVLGGGLDRCGCFRWWVDLSGRFEGVGLMS